MITLKPAATQKKKCRDLLLEQVVVFSERAELTRKVQCELESGVNEVHIENVAQRIIPDSVRVDGRGNGIIRDVRLLDTPEVHETADPSKAAEIRTKYEDKQEEINELKDHVNVLQKRVEVLDKVVEGASNSVVHPPKDSREPFVFSKETLESLTNLYSFYDDISTSVRSQLRAANKALEKSEKELSSLRQELNLVEHRGIQKRWLKSIVIRLESESGGPVELEVSYQVSGASWRPSYDLRVDTSAHGSLKINYFGNILQNTGEDWSTNSLVLSTAQSCSGGEVPELGVLEAVLYRPPQRIPIKPPIATFGMSQSNTGIVFGSGSSQAMAFAAPPVMEKMKKNVATVAAPEENALSTEFTITKPAAIPSDSAEHKVIIGVADLCPQLVHECVPSKNPRAFLVAYAVNSSSFPFLAGGGAVYLNNCFVTKTQMKNVSPGERFKCSFGVDTAVRVEYKPAKKFHEQLGIINRCSSTVHEQMIVIKNTRAHPVLLRIKEQVPRSTDEKVKVRLIAPELPRTDEQGSNGEGDTTSDAELIKEGIRMNGGILEWTELIQNGKSKEFLVKWIVECPRDERVEFVERR